MKLEHRLFINRLLINGLYTIEAIKHKFKCYFLKRYNKQKLTGHNYY